MDLPLRTPVVRPAVSQVLQVVPALLSLLLLGAAAIVSELLPGPVRVVARRLGRDRRGRRRRARAGALAPLKSRLK